MEIEKEYIEKKIKNELINKDFETWNKETINFLVSIYEHDKYNDFYSINLILLNDYINWYKKNVEESENSCKNSTDPLPIIDDNLPKKHIIINDMYELKDLTYIYSIINDDIYHNIRDNYINILNYKKSYHTDLSIKFNYLLNNNLFYVIIGIFLTIFYITIKYILYFFQFRKREEKKHIFEIKIPIPDNCINNSLIKLFLGENNNTNNNNINDNSININNLSKFIPALKFDNIKDNIFEKMVDIFNKFI